MAYIELCGVKKSETGQFFRRQLIETQDKYTTTEQYRKAYNNTDFYRSVFEYQTNDLNSTLIKGPFILDLDNNNFSHKTFNDMRRAVNLVSMKLAEEFYVSREEQELFFSGNKGFHITVQPEIFGIDYSSELAEQYKHLAELLSGYCTDTFGESFIDLKVYDRRRILRVVNSKNGKSGLYKIPLRFNELTTYEDLIEKAKTQRLYNVKVFSFNRKAWSRWVNFCNNVTVKNIRGKKENKPDSKPSTIIKRELLPCAKKLLRTSISQGSRNNLTVTLASMLFQAGLNSDEVWDKLKDWNDNNDPPLPEGELMHTMMSARHMVSQDKKYGCAAVKEFGYCEPRNCRILLNRPR